MEILNKKGVASSLIVVIIVLVSVGASLGYSIYDQDSDGLKNYEEWTGRTSFTDSDSDDDGLEDGIEMNEIGTGPLDADSDDDGLEDGLEVNDYETDPLEVDSDDDGLDDYQEVAEFNTDPTVSDTDNDGLDDYQEVAEFNTDPTVSDTDSDGLEDGPEINDYETDPTSKDTDNDGLEDGKEVSLPRADPLVRDIFVEVDWTETSESLSAEAKRKLKDTFSQAPVKNPDGSSGINLHIDMDNEVPTNNDTLQAEDNPGSLNDFYDFKDRFFSSEHEGTHHYALLTRFVKKGEETFGGIAVEEGFMVSTYVKFDDGEQFPEPEKSIGTTFMHELGHALGLNSRVFSGIDSENYSYDEYPSIMNYNSPRKKVKIGGTIRYNYYSYVAEDYQYSSGGAFNDWAYLAEGFRTP